MDIPAPHAPHTPWVKSLGLGVALSVVVCLVVLAFSWPSVTMSPKNLPVVITGPDAVVQQVEAGLNQQADGMLTLTKVTDRQAAVTAIEQRDAYGGIVVGPAPEVLTSSASSTATNQLMTQLHGQLSSMAQQQAAAAGAPNAAAITVPLTDVVPLSADDPRGAGLTAAAFPLVMGGMMGGIGISFIVSGAWRRIGALFAYSIVSGLAIAAIMQGWFGVLEGSYLRNSAAFSLTLLAMGAMIVGCASLFGRVGIAIGPILFMFIGNPISATAFPKEFYPSPWGAIGQLLPPGAGSTLIREFSYFPQANTTFPIVVLSCWAALGLILTVIGHFRDQAALTGADDDAETPEPAVASRA